MSVGGGVGDPLGHLRAAAVTESEHPVKPEDPPPSFWRNQLIVLALVIGLPLAGWIVWRLL